MIYYVKLFCLHKQLIYLSIRPMYIWIKINVEYAEKYFLDLTKKDFPRHNFLHREILYTQRSLNLSMKYLKF